jgi:predicted flap endonuclease-1-like 5' DNA nuclease
MMPSVSQHQAAGTSELTARIGKVARRELALNGYTRYEQLTQVTAAQLLAIHGVGPKAIQILEEELAARGQAFQRSRPKTRE